MSESSILEEIDGIKICDIRTVNKSEKSDYSYNDSYVDICVNQAVFLLPFSSFDEKDAPCGFSLEPMIAMQKLH